MELAQATNAKACIRGERVDDLYDREEAEKAEIKLLTRIGKLGFSSFSLAWLMVDRQWQIVAFAE
jgi:3'-phosphoadenosine 5'-phosphosulfate sulfotransferase